MPATPYPTSTSAKDLTELSAILRAIALDRKGAAPALRGMAAHYENQAAACQLGHAWHLSA